MSESLPRGALASESRATTVVVDRATALCLAVLGVALTASIPYRSALHRYFLSDDFGLIQLFSQKPTLHFLTLFGRAWTEAIYGIQPDELRPMLALSYQLDTLWGGAPSGYHASSIALHVANALLVLGVARVAGRLSLAAATFVAMLWAVLPVHPESVVWISGRADSIPALFLLAAFLSYARWRQGGPSWLFGLAIGAHFLALFSKQSAIVLPAALVLYDLLAERRPLRPSWRWLAPYVPFAGLTAGYLALRLTLFGNAVREQSLSLGMLEEFAYRQARYLKMLLYGSPRVGAELTTPELALLGHLASWVAIALALGLVLRELWRVQHGRGSAWSGRLLFFAAAWWLLGVAPLAVTYESPRHLYLPSAGVAVGAGLLVEALGRCRGRLLASALGVLLIVGALSSLALPIAAWNEAADVSARMRNDLERELRSAPAGSLLVLGTPVVGARQEYHAWLWMWAFPFVLEPPFMPPGLAQRVHVVEPPDAYCCLRSQWLARTTTTLAAWSAQPERPPALVLQWDAASGRLRRQTEAERPDLRQHLAGLASAPDPVTLCAGLDELLGNIGAMCTP